MHNGSRYRSRKSKVNKHYLTIAFSFLLITCGILARSKETCVKKQKMNTKSAEERLLFRVEYLLFCNEAELILSVRALVEVNTQIQIEITPY